MSEALGNMVDRAMVGEATRRDARGQNDRDTLLAAVNAIRAEIDRRNVRKGLHEARIAELNNAIRGRGRLDRAHYRRLCDEQTEIKVAMKEIDAQNNDARVRLRQLEDDLPPVEKPEKLDKFEIILQQLKTISGKLSMLGDEITKLKEARG